MQEEDVTLAALIIAGKCILFVLDLLALSLSRQQYSTFLPLQPSSVEILVHLPKDGEKDAVSSSSQR